MLLMIAFLWINGTLSRLKSIPLMMIQCNWFPDKTSFARLCFGMHANYDFKLKADMNVVSFTAKSTVKRQLKLIFGKQIWLLRTSPIMLKLWNPIQRHLLSSVVRIAAFAGKSWQKRHEQMRIFCRKWKNPDGSRFQNRIIITLQQMS